MFSIASVRDIFTLYVFFKYIKSKFPCMKRKLDFQTTFGNNIRSECYMLELKVFKCSRILHPVNMTTFPIMPPLPWNVLPCWSQTFWLSRAFKTPWTRADYVTVHRSLCFTQNVWIQPTILLDHFCVFGYTMETKLKRTRTHAHTIYTITHTYRERAIKSGLHCQAPFIVNQWRGNVDPRV